MLYWYRNRGGNEMKKKVNYYKIGALVFLLIEIWMLIFINKEAVKESINLWRLYVACIMFIPVNVIFICIKQKRTIKGGK